jgi:hypothetical protein
LKFFSGNSECPQHLVDIEINQKGSLKEDSGREFCTACPGNLSSLDFDIILGLRMVTDGRFADAIEHLKRYRNVDAILCPAIAYCYFMLSTQQPVSEGTPAQPLPRDLALAAREQMMELVTLKPPVNRLRSYDVAEDPAITKIFWFRFETHLWRIFRWTVPLALK